MHCVICGVQMTEFEEGKPWVIQYRVDCGYATRSPNGGDSICINCTKKYKIDDGREPKMT